MESCEPHVASHVQEHENIGTDYGVANLYATEMQNYACPLTDEVTSELGRSHKNLHVSTRDDGELDNHIERVIIENIHDPFWSEIWKNARSAESRKLTLVPPKYTLSLSFAVWSSACSNKHPRFPMSLSSRNVLLKKPMTPFATWMSFCSNYGRLGLIWQLK